MAPLGGAKGAPRHVVALVNFSSAERLEADAAVVAQELHGVSPADVRSYLGAHSGYLWHISDVLLLKEPVEFPHTRGQVNFAKLSEEASSRAVSQIDVDGNPEVLEKSLRELESLRKDDLPKRVKTSKDVAGARRPAGPPW